MIDIDSKARRFALVRLADSSGTSGVGHVADGCRFADGSVALRWRGKYPATSVWPDLASMIAVHGHAGATVVEWLDPVATSCTASMITPEIERWIDCAARALADHGPIDGLCRIRRAAWPCPTCTLLREHAASEAESTPSSRLDRAKPRVCLQKELSGSA
jgi:hypothetical protein